MQGTIKIAGSIGMHRWMLGNIQPQAFRYYINEYGSYAAIRNMLAEKYGPPHFVDPPHDEVHFAVVNGELRIL